MLTLNNPSGYPLSEESIPKDVRYLVYQLEAGVSGTPHLQMYMELIRPQRVSWIKKWLPTVHIEVAHTDKECCKEYCTKIDTRVNGPWEYGTWICAEGKKATLASSMKRAMEGESLEKIMIDDPESYSSHKGALKKAWSLFHQNMFFDRYKELEYYP
ncbi:Master replication protein [Camellia lanceoleosa]|uniref:Master replication protein n=1 Tax=Camellia lanceoleosa TaxID=1840588 RepID=A0ACC0I7X7_9ERIC|nr:Master replication protein [Camellia lanceoleosa]